MKIGLLAYHTAINFGASLQLLSTWCYLRNHGHEPVILNWVAEDLERGYELSAPEPERLLHRKLRREWWTETKLCRTSRDVAREVENLGLEAVIIGSDAVAQHHPLMERLAFPCRTVVGVKGATSDRLFPNAFWADWQDFLPSPVPVAVISASCQDSAYQWFLPSLIRRMSRRVSAYSYLSVRDTWTQRLYHHICGAGFMPPVTPDPVFSFLQNAEALLPSRGEVLERFALPERYILLSFLDGRTVNQDWLNDFVSLAQHEGIACVSLPFADRCSFGRLPYEVSLPLSPLDWFSLIRFSSGYVGHNMHPIVVALHTGVPFFSFDNYGIQHFNGLWPTDSSSKIKHLLSAAGVEGWRISCIRKFFSAPAPAEVFNRLNSFPADLDFARRCQIRYAKMMEDVLSALSERKEEWP